VGDIIERDGDHLVVDVKNRFELGDELELMTPSGNISFTLSDLTNRNDQPVEAAPGSGHIVKLPIPTELQDKFTNHDVEFGLLMRTLQVPIRS